MPYLDARQWITCVLAGALTACSAGAGGPFTSDERVARTSQKLLFPGFPFTPYKGLNGPNAAETATLINVNSTHSTTVVAFNYDDHAHVTYTSTTRTIAKGAAETGWSWMDYDNGVSGTPNRISPPTNWGAMWGDPGIGQVAGTGYVYISSLAIPAFPSGPGSKFPCTKRDRHGQCTNWGTVQGSVLPNYLGGACIARSTDGGRTFNQAANDCIHTANFDPYDGSDIQATSGGAVLTAFDNLGAHVTDAWYAPTPTAAFTQLSNPFPGKGPNIHPRLFAFQSRIYIAQAVGNNTNEIWLNYYDTVAKRWASDSLPQYWPMRVTTGYFGDYNMLPAGCGTPGGPALRGGADYDLMVNQVSGGTPLVRVTFTEGSSYLKNGVNTKFTGLETAQCDVDHPANGCTPLHGIVATGTDGFLTNCFFPAVGTSWDPTIQAPAWKLTWLQTSTTSTCSTAIFSTNLDINGNEFLRRQETGVQNPCPRLDGYWGDYDVHLGVYQPDTSFGAIFARSFADSTDSTGASQCLRQWQWTSSPVQVSQFETTTYGW